LGTLVLAILGLALLIWAVVYWRKPVPYKPNSLAMDWYNKGTDGLRNGAFLQASKAFEQAVANDDKFALAHARLAEAWSELDYADKAKDEMLRVQSLVPNRSQLASSDALYLEAINATITRDFPGAINAYAELVRLAPDQPQVYLDLGRAYEKNDDLKKAIDNYVEASNRDPQYATAFLRAAVLYGRQLDMAKASAAFDKANALYQALGNYEVQAEVSFQRGFLFLQLEKFAEAHREFDRSLDLARTTSNKYGQVKALLKLGDVVVAEGNEDQGRQYMRQAIELAEANGIDNLTKRGLVDLGNTFLVSADYTEAEKYFKESLELAQKQKDGRNAARALLSLGSLAERRNSSDESAAYIEQALPFYLQGGYRKETLQALALLARVRVQKGDYDAALKAFEQQLQLTQQFGDQPQMGLAHEDIGLLFIRQGRYPEALGHFEESYGIAKSLGVQKNVALSLTDRANALWRLGRYDEARAALSEASLVAEHPDAAKNLSSAYYLALARIALSERRFMEAETKAQQALTLADAQVKSVSIAATYTLGSVQSLAGRSREGQLKCEQAVSMARQSRDPSLLSEALLSFAEVLVQTGDSAGALKAALESQELFARFGRQDYEWLAWLAAARVSHNMGDNQKARDYAMRAESLLSGLQQKWGGDNYNSYLNRVDVQFSRKQLSELIAAKP
jgi:tetratricopeptide (TPR) repeat protein